MGGHYLNNAVLQVFFKCVKLSLFLLILLTYLMLIYVFGAQIKETKEFPLLAKQTTAVIIDSPEHNNYVDVELKNVPTISTIQIPTQEYKSKGTLKVYYHPDDPSICSIYANGDQYTLVAYTIAIFVITYMMACAIYITLKDIIKMRGDAHE